MKVLFSTIFAKVKTVRCYSLQIYCITLPKSLETINERNAFMTTKRGFQQDDV